MRIRRSTATVLMVNLFGVLVALGLIELVLPSNPFWRRRWRAPAALG